MLAKKKTANGECLSWYYLSLISNSLPTNEDICSSVIITWSVCYSACAKVLCFTSTNEHGRSTEANVMSSTAFCRTILSAARKKDGERGTKTQNRRRFLWCWGYLIGYDAKTAKNSFSGIQSRIRWLELLSLRSLGKNVFPRGRSAGE